MNLSTAISSQRAKEVGMRKTVGAQKRQLIFQFMSESLMLCLMSLGIQASAAGKRPFIDGMIVVQFAISVILMISTLVVYQHSVGEGCARESC